MSRPLLVVGCTSGTPHGRHALTRLVSDATARGLPVVGLDTPLALARAWRPEGLAGVAPVDWSDGAALAGFAAEQVGRFSGVLTHREQCVLPTAQLAQALRLPGNDPEAVLRMQDKARCRTVLRNAGLRQPQVLVFDGAAVSALTAVPDALGPGPWVVKPRVGTGSAGVAVVHDAQSLADAVRTSRRQGPVLVEQFVLGNEFSCEGALCGGVPVILAVTRKEIDERCVEAGHRVPAAIIHREAELEVAVCAAFKALGISRGLFHVEFWLEDEITLGELHARPGGDFIHALVEASRPGLDLFGILMDDLLCAPQRPIPQATRAAGSQYLTFPQGLFQGVRGWPEATRGLLAAELLVATGARLTPPLSSEDRHAVLVAEGLTVAEVDATLRAAAESLTIEVA